MHSILIASRVVLKNTSYSQSVAVCNDGQSTSGHLRFSCRAGYTGGSHMILAVFFRQFREIIGAIGLKNARCTTSDQKLSNGIKNCTSRKNF